MIAFVLPTRNRPERLARTLDALGKLTLGCHAELIIADNASDNRAAAPARLANGIRTRMLALDSNMGAAARNAAADAASPACSWIVMLDDDSHPVEQFEPFAATVERLLATPAPVAAVMADIHLPALGRRESGGLPEVFVGCGVAIRREAFREAGGYDPSFGYYVEEYDLAAKLLLRGRRVAFDPGFVVHHHKVEAGRDMNLILERLIRNNGWVAQRYAPEAARREALREHRRRYRAIASKENALTGFARGLRDLRRTLRSQRRAPMPGPLWDRFTGLAAAREAILAHWRVTPFRSAAIIEPGKNCRVIERALAGVNPEAPIELTTADQAEALIIGTLSPGPMLDAADRWRASGRRVITPWEAGRASAPFPRHSRAVA